MVHIPQNVQRRPPDVRGAGWKAWYQPANTQRDLPHGVRTKAMDDFLMSDRLQQLVLRIGEDIEGEARGLAIEGGLIETGDYVNSFDTQVGPPVTVEESGHLNPRVSVRVLNDDQAAPAVEYGNRSRQGRRILLRAGLQFHTPNGAP